MKLQQLRFPKKLDFQVNLEKGSWCLGIPKLLLQPIIENALNHGIVPKGCDGSLVLDGRLDGGLFALDITDNGVGMEDDILDSLLKSIENDINQADEYYIGLSNVYHRIKLLFGKEYGLSISSVKGQFTKVSMVLPAMTKREMDVYVQASDR